MDLMAQKKGAKVSMEHNKEIKYKRWTIQISVLDTGFDIGAICKEGIPMPSVWADFGKLKGGIEGMKEKLDAYEKGMAVGLKELEDFQE
ncbi:hypothetical protein LCGC14_1200870 [marine sediment metagenome]|uniref:Uncharacterized protein n=1 Tax=marine sediment metagenome TaxID=412755 RepID=A0A0F9M493_9ZZZZ